MKHFSFICTLALLLTVTLAACSGTAAPDILTTSTILADITRNVVGDRHSVGSLLPVGADPHSYQPTPQDSTKIDRTKVIIINGAGYEQSLASALDNVEEGKPVIEASGGLRLRTDPENIQGTDPHLWLDPNNVIVYVENIRQELTSFDPDGAEIYNANASAYIAKLEELDAWINGQVTQIPAERKVLVTNHEDFGYFAERYGFTIVGAVVESFSSDASPSAEQMASLIDQIKLYEAPAIFLDASDNPDFANQIAAETGVQVVSDLHLESLTDGAPAQTYIDMMRHNVTRIVEALK